MNGILFAATVEGIRSRKDKTVALTLGTQELTPEKAGLIFNTNSQLVSCYLSVKETVTAEEQEIIDSIEVETPSKTPSQRLRNVMYLIWKHSPEGYKDFNMFYLHHMEKVLEHFKSKLPKLNCSSLSKLFALRTKFSALRSEICALR